MLDARLTRQGDHVAMKPRLRAGYCWGDNGRGQLGTGSLVNQRPPDYRLLGGAAARSLR